MNSLRVSNHIINFIVKESKEKVHQNKIVKTMTTHYTLNNSLKTKNDLMLQAGAQYDVSNQNFFVKQLNSEQKPKSSIKDQYSFFSVKKIKQQNKEKPKVKENMQVSKKVIVSSRSNSKQRGKHESFENIQCQRNEINLMENQSKKQKIQQTLFIKLQKKPQNVPRFVMRKEQEIHDLRELKNSEFIQNQKERKKQEGQSKLNTQRQKKLTSYLQNHIYRQNSDYTYDSEGNMLLFDHESNKKAIAKQYPPTIRYEVQNENAQNIQDFNENHNNDKHSKNHYHNNNSHLMNHNIRGAKGEIFKSSVLKTINLSRISLGGSPNQEDELQFMKRNDLFNNNHCRQTTSIPFMKVQGGSFFKESSTNMSVGNRENETDLNADLGFVTRNMTSNSNRARSHESRARSSFRKYGSNKESKTQCNSFIQKPKQRKMYAFSSKNSKQIQIHKLGDSRYSSFYVNRPHTTQVGRIKRQNQQLFTSMLQF